MKRLASLRDLDSLRRKIRAARDPNRLLIAVCGDTGCRANGSLAVAEIFAGELHRHRLKEKVVLKVTGCPGFCQQGPVVIVFILKGFFTAGLARVTRIEMSKR